MASTANKGPALWFLLTKHPDEIQVKMHCLHLLWVNSQI